jgi:hypothetical protein
LTKYKWKGTVRGCYCPFYIIFSLKRRECTSEDYEDLCRSVYPIKPQDITDLGSFSLCGKPNEV